MTPHHHVSPIYGMHEQYFILVPPQPFTAGSISLVNKAELKVDNNIIDYMAE